MPKALLSSAGSSPLARGLLGGGRLLGDHRGIIPARTGFTHDNRLGDPEKQDHPRSRGVYPPSPPSSATQPGSSPLARGLLAEIARVAAWGRIIPARAGFTGTRHAGRRPAQDHPRSRGVYRPRDRGSPWALGSSPLARGLRGLAAAGQAGGGIIPARAGFTAATGARTSPHSDHPRSRGVYAIETDLCSRGYGSSPLARGLPLGVGGQAARPGIIPARAGFTR